MLALHVVGARCDGAERWPAQHELPVAERELVGEVGRAVGELQHRHRPVHLEERAEIRAEAIPVEVLVAPDVGELGRKWVAVSGVGGHLEIVKNDETGLVFLPDNVCECAIALRKLLNNPAKANWMADNFRAEILERFSWQRCANEYAQLILGKDTCQAENSSNTRPPSNSEAA